MRIKRLTKILDHKFINPILRTIKANKTAKILLNAKKREDQIQDHIRLEVYIYISHVIKVIELMTYLSLTAYILGILFYFYIDYIHQNFDAMDASSDFEPELSFINNPNFNNIHIIRERTRTAKNIVMTYYAMTTLTTVGFGDYYPVTNSERLIVVPILFCGYIAFSLM